jgi:hypothetical protein
MQAVLGRLGAATSVNSGATKSEIVRSQVGLLVQGRSDFGASEIFPSGSFSKQALCILSLPFSPTLHQRTSARTAEMFNFAAPVIEILLGGQRPNFGVLPCRQLPLDVDTFSTDKGETAKQCGRTDVGA